MGITNKDGRWIFVKRVPKRFRHIDCRTFARIALRTDSRAEALRKAPAVEAELFAHWQALADGESDSAVVRYETARRLAEAHGFAYVPSDQLITGPLEEILRRVEAMRKPNGSPEPKVVREALIGAHPPPPVLLSDALAEFFVLTSDRLVGKSDGQIRRWRLPRERAVRNFVSAVGDRAVDAIGRQDALTFRSWWQERITTKSLDPSTANKDFGHLSDVFRTWSELKGRQLENPFARLRFKEKASREAAPFSADWIADRLLAPAALDGLNDAARDVFLVMVNTGARPSEIIDARPEDFHVDAEIPYLAVRARDGRTLKTDHSRRDIPLTGVSLEAARRLATSGGCTRYREKANAWSAAVNKYLAENGLRETPAHTAYSLRHAFEDRLLEAGVDERLRVELMGHKYKRPAYGRGGSLELKRAAIAKISI